MRPSIRFLAAVMFCSMVALNAGCGGSRPQPADPNVARAILQAALEAWKKGEPPAALQEQGPFIVVADREWARGTRLLAFKVDNKDQLFGANLRCTVQLTLDGAAQGKPHIKKARYSVGTHQAFTVVREDDD